MVPLGDVISLSGSRAGSGSQLPVYAVTKHDGFVPSLEYFKKQVFSRDTSSYRRVDRGEFAYATIHLDEGSIGIAPEAALISPMYTVFRADQELVDSRYLLRLLKSPQSMTHYGRLGRGAVHRRKSISFQALSTMMIPLPDLAEQRRIAAILDQADTLRNLTSKRSECLRVLISSTFEELFGQEKASRWESVPLGDLAQTRLGKMVDAKKQTGRDSRKYLRNSNVQWFKVNTLDLLEMDFDEDERETFALRPGDILMCEGGQPGRSAIWRGEVTECYFQKALHRIRPGSRLRAEYFVYFMHQLEQRGGLKDYVTSATIAHLTGVKLRRLPVPVPPIAIQDYFADYVRKHEAQLEALDRECSALDRLFASLQHRAFRGEL